jgi:TolB-like protein
MSFFGEIKRRRVFQVVVVYAVVAWLVIQIIGEVSEPLNLPGWLDTVVIVLLAVGFPIAMILAWAYQIAPGGVIRTQAELDESLDRSSLPSAAVSPGVSESRQRSSIVVLPFDNLSPDPGDAYFSDGLTEEIITNLAYLRSLRVISRSTAMVLKNTQKDVQTIGQDLDVEYVLEGSVRKAGDSLRITAQLIDARSDEHVWAEQHDGSMGDVFAVQEQIAKLIVDALKLELSPAEEKRLVDYPIEDPKAYETWMLAVQEWRRLSATGAQRGIELAEQVLEMTGENARVYAFLGCLHYQTYELGIAHDEATLDRGEEYASKALELDPTLPQALFAKGLIRYKRGDIQALVRHVRPAAELSADSDALAYLAFTLAEVGKVSDARRYADEAAAADPLAILPVTVQALVDLFEENPGTALERIRDGRNRVAPGEPFAGWWVAQFAAYAGEEAEAREEASAVAGMDGGLWTDFCELFRRALDKDRDGVMEQLNKTTITEPAKTDEMYPLFLANTMAHIGEYDAALEWLERSINWGFSNYRFLSEGNRFLTPLKGDQRFEALLSLAKEKQKGFDA